MSSTRANRRNRVVRPSACLVLVNEQNEVLLVHRNPKSPEYAGVHVFPGGHHDARHDASLRETAIRETFEETGVLLASPTSEPRPQILGKDELENARAALCAHRLGFGQFLKQYGLQPDVDLLLPFTEWPTMSADPLVHHTHFFLAFLPTTPSPIHHPAPTPDASGEVLSAYYTRPVPALTNVREKRITLMPPQFYLLSVLAELLPSAHIVASERARVRELASGAFGKMVMLPASHGNGPDQDGRITLTYPGDEARSGRSAWLHRCVGKWDGRIFTEMVFVRNFDLFTEAGAVLESSKAKM